MSRPPEGPEDVLALAHAWEREALRARAKGDIQRADQLDENAARARELVAAWQRLQPGDQSGNTGDVVTQQSVRVSLRAVAEAVGVSHALLSQARAGKRRIKRSIAEKIGKITPALPANRKTWPKGWVPE